MTRGKNTTTAIAPLNGETPQRTRSRRLSSAIQVVVATVSWERYLAIVIVVAQAVWAIAIPIKNVAVISAPTFRVDSVETETHAHWDPQQHGINNSASFVIPGSTIVPTLEQVLDIVIGQREIRSNFETVGSFDLDTAYQLLAPTDFHAISKYYTMLFQATEFPGGVMTPRTRYFDSNMGALPDDALGVWVRPKNTSGQESSDWLLQLSCSQDNAKLQGTRCFQGNTTHMCYDFPKKDDDPRLYEAVNLHEMMHGSTTNIPTAGFANNIGQLYLINVFHDTMTALFSTKSWKKTLEAMQYVASDDEALANALPSVFNKDDGRPLMLEENADNFELRLDMLQTQNIESCLLSETFSSRFYTRAFVLEMVQSKLLKYEQYAPKEMSVTAPKQTDTIVNSVLDFDMVISSGARYESVSDAGTKRIGDMTLASVTTASMQLKLDKKLNGEQVYGSSLRMLEYMAYYPEYYSYLQHDVHAGTQAHAAYDSFTFSILGSATSGLNTFKDDWWANTMGVFRLYELPKSTGMDPWWDDELQIAAWFQRLEASTDAPFYVFDRHLDIQPAALVRNDNPKTCCHRAFFKAVTKLAFLSLLGVSQLPSYLVFMGNINGGARPWFLTTMLRFALTGETIAGSRYEFSYSRDSASHRDDGSAWVAVPLLHAMLRNFGAAKSLDMVMKEFNQTFPTLVATEYGQVHFTDQAHCKLGFLTQNVSDATNTIQKVMDKIYLSVVESVRDILDAIPELHERMTRELAEQHGIILTDLRDEMFTGSPSGPINAPAIGSPVFWTSTAFTAGMLKMWPGTTPPSWTMEAFRNATVCYRTLEMRYLNQSVRCWVEPSNVHVSRVEYSANLLRNIIFSNWSISLVLNAIAIFIAAGFISRLWYAWRITHFQDINVWVALQLNFQGLGVLSFPQIVLLAMSTIPLLLGFHLPVDNVFIVGSAMQRWPKVIKDIFVTLSVSWFNRLGYEIVNHFIFLHQVSIWFSHFRMRALSMSLILILRIATPDKMQEAGYELLKLISTVFIAMVLGALSALMPLYRQHYRHRGSSILCLGYSVAPSASRSSKRDNIVVASLQKHGMPLNKHGLLGFSYRQHGWALVGLLVEGWELAERTKQPQQTQSATRERSQFVVPSAPQSVFAAQSSIFQLKRKWWTKTSTSTLETPRGMAPVSDAVAYETALQREGDDGLTRLATTEMVRGDARETLQIAFHEQFAMARSVSEKRDTVRTSLLPGTADALYYSALCDLHELQLLLLDDAQDNESIEEEQTENDGGESAVVKATQFLEQNKAHLMNVIQQLSMKQCYKKATRVQQRMLLLELELRSRVQASLEASKENKVARASKEIDSALGIDYVATETNMLRMDSSLHDVDAIAVDIVSRTWMPLTDDDGVVKDDALVNEQIALTTKELGAALGIAFTDAAPASVAASVDTNTLPTHLDNILFDINAIVVDIINRTWGRLDDNSLRGTAQGDLCALDIHARELIFNHLLYNAGGTTVTDAQRWALLELFLDEFAFECVDVKGYLDVIVEDIKRESVKPTNRGFGFRQVHNKLSVPHLNYLMEMEPALFRDNIKFAVRGVQLLQAEAEDSKKELLDRRDSTQSTKELEHLSACLAFTSVFSGRLNGLRLILLYQKLLLLQRRHWRDPTDSILLQTLLEYIQLPRSYAGSMFLMVSIDVPRENFVDFDGSADTTCAALATQLGFESVYKDTDRLMIEKALSTLWRAGMPESVEAALDNELDKAFLQSVKARCMIKTGQGNPLEWSKHLPRQENNYLAKLSSSSELAFCDSSPTYFNPGDELVIHIRARNIKHVTAHLYEVRSADYYSRFRKEIPESINVDGLLPNDEQHIDLSHLSAFQESRISISFPRTRSKRGIFVVEVLENGQTCRAILRKGFLRHVEWITMNGQEMMVLDEDGEVIQDAKVVVLNTSRKAQPARTYTADATGKILVPFRNIQQSAVADRFAIVYCHGDFGSFSPFFKYFTGDLKLIADLHIDCQQLVSGATAQLITQPRVYIGATQLPLDGLTNVNVTINFSKVSGADAGDTKEDFRFAGMNEFQHSSLSFEIPLDTDFFTVSLSASKARDESSLDADSSKLAARRLSTSKRFSVQHVTKYPLYYSPHLIRRPIAGASPTLSAQDFSLLLLGHNGEAIQNTEVQLYCKHVHSTKYIVVRLQSDSNGEIKLGALDGVRQVSVGLRWSWDLPNVHQTDLLKAQHVNCATGDPIEIPIPTNCQSQLLGWYENNLVSLYRVIRVGTSNRVLESAASSSTIEIIKNETGTPVLVSVTIRSAGLFALCIRPVDLQFPISVVGKKTELHSISSDALIQQKQLVLASPSRPLVIFSQSIKRDNKQDVSVLEIQLRNFSHKSTQVIVTLKQFLDPQKKSICQVLAKSLQPDPVFETLQLENKYLKKRKMSDEYQYILKRRLLSLSKPNSLVFLGESSLPKPSLLQTPFEIDRTDMEDVVMGTGDKVLDTALNRSAMLGQVQQQQQQQQRRYARASRSGYNRADGIPSTAFLVNRPQLVSTWEVSTDGIVRIDLGSLEFFSAGLDRIDAPGAFEVIVVAVDHAKGQVCSSESLMTLPTDSQEQRVTEISKRDIRLMKDQALQPQSGHYLLKQLHDTVRADTKRILARSSSTKYAVYGSIEDALKLWKRLCRENEVHKLIEHLQEWNQMDRDAKIRFYFANASDDLNVFLLRKDPAFFQLFVRPLVESKISKSLIDSYLLDDKIALHNLYSAPGVFQGLSVIEKLLIAERMSSASDVERICERVHLDAASASTEHKMKSLFASVIAQHAITPNALGTAPRSENASQLHQIAQMEEAAFIDDIVRDLGSDTSHNLARLAHAPLFAMPMGQMRAPPRPDGMDLSLRSNVRNCPASRRLPAYEDDDQDDFANSDDNFGVESVPSDDENEDEGSGVSSEKPRAAKAENAYIPPGKVRMLQDKRFFHTQRAQLDGKNSFWKAYAEYLLRVKSSPDASESRFVSSYLPEALLSLSEGLLALAFVDLPMQTTGSTHITSLPCSSQVELMPKNDVLLYHQSIEVGDCEDDPNSKLIVKQSIVHFQKHQAMRKAAQSSERVLEVVVGTKYTCEVNVSNTTDSELSGVNLLMQIPQGAIPLGKSSYYTRNHVFNAPANTTTKYVVHFYFPEAGEYDQYPAHAAIDGKVVAWAKNDTTVTVLRKMTLVDLTSWSDVAARGSVDEVVEYLSSQKDMLDVDLGLLFWRCKGISFYCGLISFLRGKVIYNEGIWKYAFVHSDLDAIKEYLRSATSLTKTVGVGLKTTFFSTTELYDYLSNDGFDHTEFGPFLRRRVHEAKGLTPTISSATGTSANGGRILNENARTFYHALCCRLEMFVALDSQQLLVLVYFMLLFNRMEDAMHLFSRLQALPLSKKAAVENTVQFDYVDSYLDLFRDQDEYNFAVARRNVAKYKNHPYARWRERFVRLGDFVAEYDAFEDHKVNQAVHETLHISGSASANDSEVTDVLPTPPGSCTLQVKLDAAASDGKVRVSSRYLGECKISFYPIDVEFMFSTKPFDTFSNSPTSTSSILLVQPRYQMSVNLTSTPSGNSLAQTEVSIPQELQGQQMMVRVQEATESREIESVAAPIDVVRPYFNSSLQVEVMKQSGMVQVFHRGLPVSRCYVKVYAKVPSSSAQFYKDGYTDLLGKFDYVGINGELITRVEKFSILMSHPKFGASVHQTGPPVLATTVPDFQHQDDTRQMLSYFMN